jgi:phage FluMu protein Com
MAEMVKCPHCGALYEIRYEKTASHYKSAADCQVCGKRMASMEGSIVPHYELVRMPDGTNV